jgi:hypothetical protein
VEDINSLRPAWSFSSLRADIHRAADSASSARISTYALIRNFHSCGDGGGCYLYSNKERKEVK